MSNHVSEWLNAYFDGELKGRQLHLVEEHLAECETCQAELESLYGLSALLHEAPMPEFTANERFVAQVNLRLPERRTAATSNKALEIGWWLIPIGLLMAWIFISTTTVVGDMVTVANNFGLLDKTTASFVSGSSNTADVTATLGQFGVLNGNNLQWAKVTESYSRNLMPQIVGQVSVALLYLTWIVIWWARRTRQGQGQLLEG